ncbi:uncharacterized protein LOC131668714 [Phymastichus coffea]|uniref:uncharacterized protein LOC131668714 n=1 Tax=Phymastichus coffea TaxID=108790 RepID=UPI00273C33FD|nr:uncharacterized protein LOC131668714 [Phymastichus coffea]
MTLTLPYEKKVRIFEMVSTILEMKVVRIKMLARCIGVLVAACPAVAYGWLHYKYLETLKGDALTIQDYNMYKSVHLDTKAREELEWWKANILPSYNKIRSNIFDLTIFSDASKTGWGATCEGMKANGFWDSQERELHINLLELRAAFFSLKCFLSQRTGIQVLLRIDNITAIAYINKMGGTKHEDLHIEAKKIWNWCAKREIWIFSEYVASRENRADEGSRISNLDTEWELAEEAFKELVKEFGSPSIDLFASRINRKCLKYCSWERDPDAFAINSLTISWKQDFWYAFPPFALIPRILKKIREEYSTGILVVPLWTEQNSSIGLGAYPGVRDTVRQSFKKKDLEEATIEIMLSSVANSTMKQYNSALEYWWKFCKESALDPFNAGDKEIVNCLTRKFNEGAAYGTLNSLRSAIALINQENNSDSPLLNRFFRGVFRTRPTAPKYCCTWDVEVVLNMLETWNPLSALSLQNLTFKLVLLLALGSAFRVQSIALIKIKNIRFLSNGVEIRISDLIKTSRPGSKDPIVFFPYFPHRETLCIARTLIFYIEKTRDLRGNTDELFISFIKPFKKVTSQTISRWIRTVMRQAGIDEFFTAHSTRHASTSRALREGLDIGTIRNAASWSENSKVFARFYNRPIVKSTDRNFAAAVIA